MPHTLYKIHYAHGLAYIGRTNQKLSDRLRSHFFKKPMHREIDIDAVTLIEYAELPSVADMYCYEILLINALKPMYNHSDRARDELSNELATLCSRLEFRPWESPLMEKWKTQIAERDRAAEAERKAEIAREIEQREMRRKRRASEITEDEYYDWVESTEVYK